LANIPDMQRRFGTPVGLSDHSMGSLGAVVGVALGACVIEKHVCLPGVESADSKFSMPLKEFAQMVKDVRNAGLIARGPDYSLTEGEKASKIFRRSLFAVRDIKKGETFTSDNIRSIRPSYGIKPKLLARIIGKAALRDISFGEPLLDEDAKY
ncbi:MAG: N-acetylneuraminate synthase family protein, partial [Sphaerochaeta sp.]|uniref:N-acetylneuraminate synthase family protein n=1 Tax=Sphaerochaeta sp. TaxID=1972642 RepID=UPI003D0B174F